MLSTKGKIFAGLSILIALIIIGILVYLFVLAPDTTVQEPDTTEQPTDNGDGSTATPRDPGRLDRPDRISTTPPATIPENVDVGENYIKQLARMFVERFGSYSNQNDNTHVDDVLPLVTPQMQQFVETQRSGLGEAYRGVTTKVIVNNLTSLDGATATVEVQVQETISTRDETDTNYRTGTVSLIQVNGEWKVDGLFWQE